MGVSLANAGYCVMCLTIGLEEQDLITPEGIRIITIKERRYSTNRFVNKLLKVLFRQEKSHLLYLYAKQLHADIYHFHHFTLVKTGLRLKKLTHKPKVIYDCREPFYFNLRDGIYNRGLPIFIRPLYARFTDILEKCRSRKFDAIIATEENVCAFFKLFVEPAKCHIIYNYTDLNPSFKIDAPIDKDIDLIYVGNIARRRGALTMIDTLAECKKVFPNISLLILGVIHEPGLKDEMDELIKSNDLTSNVTILKSVPYKEIDSYYRRSKIGLLLMHPYDSYRINMPIKLFEYMAYGIPIIANNFGHPHTYINRFETGLCVDPLKNIEIARAIIRLLTDQQLYSQLSDNALEVNKKYFRWEKMEKRLLNIYEELYKVQ